MNTFHRMSKYITLTRFRKVAVRWMGMLCLSAGLLFSQSATAQTTSNLDLHFALIKATTGGTVEFTLAPEDPNMVARSHWPIIFIDWENDGNQVTQMVNLTADCTFKVKVNNAGAVAKVYGENGTWKLICKSQNIKATQLEMADALRYLDLSKNVLGTNNSNQDYTLPPNNNKIETLNLSENQLKAIHFGSTGVLPELKEFFASENLLSSISLTGHTKLSRLDLSKNLLTTAKIPAAFVSNWKVFNGGNQAAYDAALTAATTPIGNTPSSQIHQERVAADELLNLTVNKLNIGTLPKLPTNMQPAQYYFTLQERYKLPKTEYKMLEEINLSSQNEAIGVQSKEQKTIYRWFREINPNTDEYIEMVRGVDYEESLGTTRFCRAYGEDTKVFCAMTTPAFDGTTGTYPLESFERGAGTITKQGFEKLLLQPTGAPATALKDTYFDKVKTAALNGIGDGREPKNKTTQFFRTTTMTINGRKNNLWYGFKSSDWNDPENWTGRIVPNTLEADYKDDEDSDVFFASTKGYTIGGEELDYPTNAIRDLYTDQDRVVRNLYNYSENHRAIVADAGHTLRLKGKSEFFDALLRRTIVKSRDGKPNGTFLIDRPDLNKGYEAQVELYSKAYDGNRNKQAAQWQYFGSPIQRQLVLQVVPTTSWVRKYNRLLDIADTDEKWEEDFAKIPLQNFYDVLFEQLGKKTHAELYAQLSKVPLPELSKLLARLYPAEPLDYSLADLSTKLSLMTLERLSLLFSKLSTLSPVLYAKLPSAEALSKLSSDQISALLSNLSSDELSELRSIVHLGVLLDKLVNISSDNLSALLSNLSSDELSALLFRLSPDILDELKKDSYVFFPGVGYEITQPRPMTYNFYGELVLKDFDFPIDGVPGGPRVNYKDMNILANPYTAAMKIDKIDWTAAPKAEKTVYLYNTGSREEWLEKNGGKVNGTNPGQYINAVPNGLSGYVAGMPTEIPSLSAFMIKSTGAGTVKYRYKDLFKNTAQNRAPRRRFSSLMIDVESNKSADRMWLVEAEGKTKNYDDGFDGEKIFTAASAQLYALQDRKYQISTAADFDQTELGFVAGDGAKHYTLTFHLDEMSDGKYYLLDHLTHEQKPITHGMTYSFNAGADDPANRFAISRKAKSIADDVFEGKGIELRAKPGRTIEARNYTDETAEVEIFDVSGKVVNRFMVEPNDMARVGLTMEGVVVVCAQNSQAKTTQKFIIK